MRIERIKARNFKAFQDFDEAFGDVNILSGRNGAGKSTVLDMVYAAFVTEGDRNLLREGAADGEFTVVLRDDDGETIEIRRTLKPGSVSAPQVKSSKSGAMGAAATFLKSLVDGATMDPIRRVMSMPVAEQAKILLETIKLDLNHAELAEAVSQVREVDNLRAVLQNAAKIPALDALKAVEDLVFKERTLVNRDVKTQTAHAQQLRAAVEPEAEGMSLDDGLSVTAQLEKVIEAQSAEFAKALESANLAHQQTITIFKGYLDGVDEEASRQIKQIEQQSRATKETFFESRDAQLKTIQEAHEEKREEIIGRYAAEREVLKAKHEKVQASLLRQATASQTKEAASKAEAQATGSKAKSASMTDALNRIEIIRESLLEKLPIPGLKVEGGQIYLKGVPLQEVNTGQQGKFWIGIAVRRAIDKGLGTVIIDDAEHFDDINFPAVLESCKQAGLQFFIAKVADHPFKIERWNAEQ